MNSWGLLAVAGLFEISWAVGLKYTEGFSRLLPSVLTILGSIASFVFLSLALKRLPLSIAYAVWTGMGIAGTSVLGVVLFHEAFSPGKFFFIGLIVAGIVGLRLNP
ncbi:MAG: multidrug efflux SMR transporter [Schwartzia sp.]|nr:multidrug efflux SMR transporter [Schwartzia sp. (in: firmicutes)]